MIPLPRNVILVKPGETVELPDRVFAPAPMEGLIIRDGDWFHAVTVAPSDYATQARDAEGYPIRVFEHEFDPEIHGTLSDSKVRLDADEAEWDVARQQALDFLLRVEAER